MLQIEWFWCCIGIVSSVAGTPGSVLTVNTGSVAPAGCSSPQLQIPISNVAPI